MKQWLAMNGPDGARAQESPNLTVMLQSAGEGNTRVAHQLLDAVYHELRRLAAAKMAAESTGQTLQATALVHEVWLRLSRDENRTWNDRTHFFAAAAEAMRRILVDNARRKSAVRHGGGQHRVEMPEIASGSPANDDDVLAVHEALNRFGIIDPQKAELVKLRYFVGMSIEEAADVLNISKATAKRYWSFARAWLADDIERIRGNDETFIR